MSSPLKRPGVLAWAFYDWANSAFATTVMAGFFPIFFKQYWSAGADATVSTFRLGAANSAAALVVALLAPLLGAIADRSGARKQFLFTFAGLGVTMTASLYLVHQGAWMLAVLAYGLATLGFMGANVFYDSLLIDVTEPESYDLISAFGFSLGYLGGGVLFALNVAMAQRPEWFGLADAGAAVRLSFLSVAVWWGLFSLPLLLLVRERETRDRQSSRTAIAAGLGQLADTFREIRALRAVFLFLVAYWLYIDGVNTVIKMAVDYGLALGFEAGNLITALLITQFVGFPAALAFGALGKRIGAKRGILIAIGAYIAMTVWAVFLDRVQEFYALAIAIGLVQGGVQSLSRSLYARLIPADKSGEFFGFYNMMGKFASVLGPVMVGWVALTTGSSRVGLLAIVLLFVAGGLILTRVDVRATRESPA